MTWVRAHELGKRVNLDHAASAKQTVKGEWQLFTADGRSLGVVDDDPFAAAARIVPATPGQQVWLVYGGVESERRDVVAWKVNDDAALPIIAGESPLGQPEILLIHPDGSVERPFGDNWESIDQATAAIRKELAERKLRSVP